MPGQSISLALERFTNFGDLLPLPAPAGSGSPQRELSIAVGYSHDQISRLELNQRLPDMATISARFIPVLDLEDEPQVAARLMELAAELTIQETPSPGEAPFKGLSYFDETDASTCFLAGRVGILPGGWLSACDPSVNFSADAHLAVVGASGSGKILAGESRLGACPGGVNRSPRAALMVTITPTTAAAPDPGGRFAR